MIRPINTEASDMSMKFKIGSTYEVGSGYKIWLSGTDEEVAIAQDGDPFEIEVEGAMLLSTAAVFTILGSYFF